MYRKGHQKHALQCFLVYALECKHSKAYTLSIVKHVFRSTLIVLFIH